MFCNKFNFDPKNLNLPVLKALIFYSRKQLAHYYSKLEIELYFVLKNAPIFMNFVDKISVNMKNP
jgi:hypothetical protein